ncbi:unnamed protein product [Diatraea saccharalis]|uniref:Ion transport domain-containing protein n=1 Tax=Diatraea saccharalis TaxID=40085 RepID=A0A9N9R2Z5_9NEOP|nr:unnamed protein product [Diatraea saccharalis]
MFEIVEHLRGTAIELLQSRDLHIIFDESFSESSFPEVLDIQRNSSRSEIKVEIKTGLKGKLYSFLCERLLDESAAESGNVEDFMRLYLSEPSRLAVRDVRGRTAAHQAASRNNTNILHFINNYGGDLNSRDNSGNTPLHVAVENEALDAVEFLLQQQVDTGVLNERTQAPIHLATELNKVAVLQIFAKYKTQFNVDLGGEHGRTALHFAAIHDHDLCARVLITDLGAQCKIPCNNGYYPIHEAAKNASSRTMEVFLQWGESKGCTREQMISLYDNEGNVPLHSAVHGGDIKAVELCLRSGAKISTQQHDLSTPVHLACAQGALEIVKLMFTMQPKEKMACLTSCDVQKMTPIHCAAMFDHPDIVNYLISEGSDINPLDKERRSPLLLAASRAGWRTVHTLKRAIRSIYNLRIRDSLREKFKEIDIMTVASQYIYENLILQKVNNSFKGLCVRFYNKVPSKIQQLDIMQFKSTIKKILIKKAYYKIRLGADIQLKDINSRNVLHLVVMNGGRLEDFAASCKRKDVLGENAPSYATIKNWVAEFKRGRTSTQDEHRPGRPKSATTSEIVIKIHDAVLADRRLKPSEIADIVGISKQRAYYILTQELCMKKLSAKWVPRLLTVDQKRVSQECLDRFNSNTTDFLRRFVTTDETWVHHYILESKIQFKQWTEKSHSDNMRVHTCLTAMAKFKELNYDLLPHPVYSPDLAPSDFHLFPKLKIFLRGGIYQNPFLGDAYVIVALCMQSLTPTGLKLTKFHTNFHTLFYPLGGRIDRNPFLADDRCEKSLAQLLNEKDNTGCSPLHYASREGHIRSLENLIKLGACINLKNNNNESPLHFAARYGRYHTACQLLDSDKGTFIINESDGEGLTPLHIASREGHTRVVQLLLNRGALLHRDHNGRNPLHLAAMSGYTQTIELLHSVHSHLLDQVDKDGNTPLHLATMENKPNSIALLLSMGCRLSYNNMDMSAIDYAIYYKFPEAALAMVTHENRAKEVMALRSDRHPCVTLALIAYMPRVFEAVQDKCITKANCKKDSKSFYIKYNFDALCPQLKDDDGTRKTENVPKSQKIPLPALNIKYSFKFYQHSKLEVDALRLALNDPKFRPEPLNVINAMVAHGRVELLAHPLSQKYLQMKWNSYGKYFHLANLLFYCVYLILVTVYTYLLMMNVNPSIAVMKKSIHKCDVLSNNTSVVNNSANISHSNDNITKTMPKPTKLSIDFEDMIAMYTCTVAIIVYNAICLVREAYNVKQQKWHYLVDPSNLVSWLLYICSTLMVFPTLFGDFNDIQFSAASITVFLSWFELLLLLQRFDQIGIYVVMFLEILQTLIKVLMLFSILIIAFGLAFYILLSKGHHLSFNSIPMSLMRTFAMMLGEIDFVGTYVQPYYKAETDIMLPFPIPTFFILGLFMVLMPILLMNLLIGLAVGDIESVRRNAQLKRLAMQVVLHTELERKLPTILLEKVDKDELIEYPNSKCRKLGFLDLILRKWFCNPFNDEAIAIAAGLDLVLESSEDYITNELEKQKRKLREMSQLMEQQHMLIRLIVQSEKRKSAGINTMFAEMIKLGSVRDVFWFLERKAGKVLSDWKRAVFVPLYRGEGSRVDCANYSVISLISLADKVYRKILARKMTATCRPVLEQVNDFVYLRCAFSRDGRWKKMEIKTEADDVDEGVSPSDTRILPRWNSPRIKKKLRTASSFNKGG